MKKLIKKLIVAGFALLVISAPLLGPSSKANVGIKPCGITWVEQF